MSPIAFVSPDPGFGAANAVAALAGLALATSPPSAPWAATVWMPARRVAFGGLVACQPGHPAVSSQLKQPTPRTVAGVQPEGAPNDH